MMFHRLQFKTPLHIFLAGFMMVCQIRIVVAEDQTVFQLPAPDANAPVVWDLNELYKTPRTFEVPETMVPAEPGVEAMFFEGESYCGKPTRVFAWYGYPQHAKGKVPGIVLVHGGGGTAFAYWVKLWVDRGYAALAMDTAGHIPVRPQGKDKGWQRHADCAPGGWGTCYKTIDEPVTDQWPYHAVAAVIRGHSLLRSKPQVDVNRIGITGISWGGYMTNIVAGLDDRLAFAVPVYGCGFLGEDSSWLPDLRGLGAERAVKWLSLWDPSRYVNRSHMPMLFVNGTNDKHYRMGSWQKTYRAAQGNVTLCCKVRMGHGHPPSGDPAEITAFADSVLLGGKPLVKVCDQGRTGRDVWATFSSEVPVKQAILNYTKDTGPWPGRFWEQLPITLDLPRHRVTGQLPDEGWTAWYINLVDERDLVVSTPHEEAHRE